MESIDKGKRAIIIGLSLPYQTKAPPMPKAKAKAQGKAKAGPPKAGGVDASSKTPYRQKSIIELCRNSRINESTTPGKAKAAAKKAAAKKAAPGQPQGKAKAAPGANAVPKPKAKAYQPPPPPPAPADGLNQDDDMMAPYNRGT